MQNPLPQDSLMIKQDYLCVSHANTNKILINDLTYKERMAKKY